MKNELIRARVEEILPAAQILEGEPLGKHTTFRVGGPARLFLEVATVQQLSRLMALFYETKTEYFVLGNGSNLLVSDTGYNGIILHIGSGFGQVQTEGTTVRAGAGAMLAQIASAAGAKGLTGLEFASGIPGTLGGALMMNAGAYGGEMSQVVTRVKAVRYDGTPVELTAEEMQFGYRHSLFKEEKYVAVEAEMELREGNPEEIRALMADLAAKRREKQPLEYPSAGSTFKRPEGYFAGKLIMDAGLKGYQVGGAQVAEKHCGFVINRGGATASDIWSLMQQIQEKVSEKYGVSLEPEVIMLGEFTS